MRVLLVIGVVLATALPSMAHGEDAEQAFRRGQNHFSSGEYREALSAYRAAYDKAPLPDIIFNIAQCHRNLGEYNAAKKAFESYLEKRSDASNRAQVEKTLEQLAILAKARRAIRSRRYDRAVKRYEQALEIEPLAPIHRDLARAFERLGDYDEALTAYRDYLSEQKNAEDREEIEQTIARLEQEIKGPSPIVGPVAPGTDSDPPIYKKWWFWAGVGGAIVTGAVLTVALTGDSIPGSDLGNVDFPGVRWR